MKVCHLTTSTSGGAGIAASRLSKGLTGLKVSSAVQSRASRSLRAYKQVLELIFFKFDKFKLRRIKGSYEALSSHRVRNFKYSLSKYDLCNLHWISLFVDWEAFFTDRELPPLVWTLHDMNPFLGLAHYQEDADKLRTELAEGRSLDDTTCSDLDHKTWREKQSILTKIASDQIHFVCPSQWLANEVKKSFLKRFPITVIPNGIDTKILKPINRAVAQEILSSNKQGLKTILFVADSVGNRRKGIDVLINALSFIGKPSDYELLIMGKGFEEDLDAFSVSNLSYISDDRLKSCVYSSADLFIIPSREDNLPNTVLESLACGTPVIGSNVGGIPDMVRPGLTGDLFEVGNAEDLAGKIDAWFRRDDLEQISKNCRDVAVNEYDISIQAKAYKKLYEDILKNNE